MQLIFSWLHNLFSPQIEISIQMTSGSRTASVQQAASSKCKWIDEWNEIKHESETKKQKKKEEKLEQARISYCSCHTAQSFLLSHHQHHMSKQLIDDGCWWFLSLYRTTVKIFHSILWLASAESHASHPAHCARATHGCSCNH